jgi:hypothetical protein
MAENKAPDRPCPEAELLLELSHEIANVAPGFKGSVQHTYVISPAQSSAFGLDIQGMTPYLGVPDSLYSFFREVRWHHAAVIPGRPGLFLVFAIGAGQKTRKAALRVALRRRRSDLLSRFERLTVLPMDASGEAHTEADHFELPIRTINGMEWEGMAA